MLKLTRGRELLTELKERATSHYSRLLAQLEVRDRTLVQGQRLGRHSKTGKPPHLKLVERGFETA
jgi:hypothetical protein